MNLLQLLCIVAFFLNNAAPTLQVEDKNGDEEVIGSLLSSSRGLRVGRFLNGMLKGDPKDCAYNPRICRANNSPGPDCCGGKCVNVMKDPLNCGRCFNKCPFSTLCCKGVPVNPLKDNMNCGKCGNKCKIKKGEYCTYGMCNYAQKWRPKQRRKRETTTDTTIPQSKPKSPKNRPPLGDTRINKKKKKNNQNQEQITQKTPIITTVTVSAGSLPPPEQLTFFLNQFQSANSLKLSSLELESIKDTCMLELAEGIDQDAESLDKHIKTGFGKSWKEVLSNGQISDGNVVPGSPSVVVVSTSALRSLELLRGLRSLTKDCRAAKLSAKHMKVEEQVSVLKGRVNIASGTPSRIKKLIDMEALGLSRLSVVVFDMHTDAKGYSLFTLPQVSDEFWDLYKSYFHPLIVEGNLRICLYGPISLPSKTETDV